MIKQLLIASALAATALAAPAASAATDADHCSRLSRMLPGGKGPVMLASQTDLSKAGVHNGDPHVLGHNWIWYRVGNYLCSRNTFGEFVFRNLSTREPIVLR